MRNMKVSLKLIIGFMTIALFAAIVGVSGIYGMIRMDQATTQMYENQTAPLLYISQLTTLMQRMRVGMREYTLAIVEESPTKTESTRATINSLKQEIIKQFDLYAPTLTNPEAIKLFNEARSVFEGEYSSYLEKSYQSAVNNDLAGSIQVLSDAIASANVVVNNLDECMDIRIEAASELNDETTVMAAMLLYLIIALLLVAVGVALFLTAYISGLISKPLASMSKFLVKFGTTGDLTLSEEDKALVNNRTKDEIGQCVESLASVVTRLTDVNEALGRVAGGDLTVEMKLLSDKDGMGISLAKMLDNLNSMFVEINSASGQVSSGSKQIADGAQSLAQGSTEQASVVEELSASIGEIATQTGQNAGTAREAASLSGNIKQSAEKGSQQMDMMMNAVGEINEASQSISKVIKVIDDIAFQTNILALNAAVEAARAGQHGKGFAVVADEVRNLAAKSAEAAKDTSALIENSIEKANLGMSIAAETAESLKEIVEGINRSAEIVMSIAQSSDDQANAITQVNTAIDQVAQVVQQNSATAEESAAASEEMSGQSNMLEQLIAQFKLKNSGYQGASSVSFGGGASSKKSSSMPEPSYSMPGGGGGSKY